MVHISSACAVAAVILIAQSPKPAAPFTTPLTKADMSGKQAVVATTMGTFVIDAVNGEAPVSRIDLKSVRIVQ
jgi:hypothetical protein